MENFYCLVGDDFLQWDILKKYEDNSLYTEDFFVGGCFLQKICSFVPRNAAAICDLGCGYGTLGSYISKCRPSSEVTFVDVNPVALATIRTGKVVCSDLFEYLPDFLFDCVVTRLVAHYFPFEKQIDFVKKVSALLRVNGTCVIIAPYITNVDDQEKAMDFLELLGRESLDEHAQKYISKQDEWLSLLSKYFYNLGVYHSSSFIHEASVEALCTKRGCSMQTANRIKEYLRGYVGERFSFVNNSLIRTHMCVLVGRKK